MALSLYRKYRPNVFADVVGQEHVERTLVNAVAEGNVAHAYLFCGPRGTGKTTSARLLAKALLCEKGPTPEPDGSCSQCAEIAEGIHPDVYELDAASRTGVDNVREEIVSRVQFAPTRGRYKVYIIDEVHMLTVAAFNALLKTLEEPPGHVVFIMCTTDPHKVPETVQSRCQRFDFRRFTIDEIVGYLRRICDGEGFDAELDALEFIAAKASGGMRDATTALEQIAVFTGGAVTLKAARGLLGQMDSSGLFELAGYVARRDAAAALLWLDRVITDGVDLSNVAHDLAGHFRDLYVTLVTGGEGGIVSCPASELGRYREQAQAFGGPERLARAMGVCDDLMRQLRSASDSRLSFEMALVRLCRPDSELTLESLAERIEALESAPRPQAAPAASPAPHLEAVQPSNAAENRFAEAAPEPEPVRSEDVRVKPEKEMGSAAAAPVRQAEAPTPVRQTETPAPETAPVAAMSPARLMAAVLTAVKREDEASGALLTGVELEKAPDGYTLVFPAGSEFSVRIAGSGETHGLIARAFEQVLGAPTPFTCRVGGAAKLQQQPRSAADFGAVSVQEAAAPASYVDDGYDAALEAYANSVYDYAPADAGEGAFAQARASEPAPLAEAMESRRADGAPDRPNVSSAGAEAASFAGGTAVAAEPEPVFMPSRDDLYAAMDAAASGAEPAVAEEDQALADMLSVFGDGIHFEEVD